MNTEQPSVLCRNCDTAVAQDRSDTWRHVEDGRLACPSYTLAEPKLPLAEQTCDCLGIVTSVTRCGYCKTISSAPLPRADAPEAPRLHNVFDCNHACSRHGGRSNPATWDDELVYDNASSETSK